MVVSKQRSIGRAFERRLTAEQRNEIAETLLVSLQVGFFNLKIEGSDLARLVRVAQTPFSAASAPSAAPRTMTNLTNGDIPSCIIKQEHVGYPCPQIHGCNTAPERIISKSAVFSLCLFVSWSAHAYNNSR